MQAPNDRAEALRLVRVSRETAERLDILVRLLVRWQIATNLISRTTLSSVWTRHLADSAQLINLAPGARRWVDMGSGAGFPGLVLAIQLIGLSGAVVHCIESDRRKCAFLRGAVRATGAQAEIHPMRVDMMDASRLGLVDAVTARAFAPLPLTIKLAKIYLERGAVGLFPRGRSVQNQLHALPLDGSYPIQILPSEVEQGAAIIRIRREIREFSDG